MEKVNTGFMSVAEMMLDVDRARNIAHESVKMLQRLGAEVIQPEDLVTNLKEAEIAGERFRSKDIDVLIIQHGTFSLGYLSIEVVRSLDVPLVLWGIPEPPLNGSPYTCGSMVGLIMHASAITKLGKRFKFIHGFAEDKELQKELRKFIKILETKKKLRHSKVGLLGYRTPGFYGSNFDELIVKSKIGPEIIHVDLSEILDKVEEISQKEAEKSLKEVLRRGYKVVDVSREELMTSTKIYLAIKRISQELELDSIAIKCWPELRDFREMGVCFVSSRLTDEGIMTSCEADVNGVLSMMTQNTLTEKVPFFCDLVQVDEKKNEILFFHCGNAPCSLVNPNYNVSLRQFFLGKGGVTVEFPLKPGRVTLAKLSSAKRTYKMFVTTGEAVQTGQVIRGTCVNVKLDSNVNKILEIILKEGIEQHYSMVYEDIKDELIQFCDLMGIKIVTA